VLTFCQASKSPKQNREKVLEVLAQLNEGSQDLFVGTLNKNWRAGLRQPRPYTNCIPGLVSKFDVQLANRYDPDKPKHQLPRWIWSYKLDGSTLCSPARK
jgi:hypothetical protein